VPTTISINPSRCRMWYLHHRVEEDIDERTCKAEIQSFREHGQRVPVLGRSLHGDPTHDVELIYGARRLFVARYLNVPLLVELCTCSDREGIIAMNVENGQRTDISPYERGLGYERWLRAGHFASQEDIARALNISPSQVCRLLKVAQLPRLIVDAFGGPRELPEAWGVQIAKALGNPRMMERCMQAAQAITTAASRLPAHEVYQVLLASMSSQSRLKAAAQDRVVKDENGASLFSIRSRDEFIALIVPRRGVSPEALQEITSAIEKVLCP
jgi:ParB family transcriptional regulator, chromosome partitioning protein